MTGCPFASAHADLGAAAASGCPFAALINKRNSTAETTNSQDTAAAASSSTPLQQHPPGTCPLGFGSARGPSLSTLHCPLCRGLLFAACSTEPCHHIFCSSCISKFQDCPLCGRDIEGTTPDATLQGRFSIIIPCMHACSCKHPPPVSPVRHCSNPHISSRSHMMQTQRFELHRLVTSSQHGLQCVSDPGYGVATCPADPCQAW
jgi:hypothetical protein